MSYLRQIASYTNSDVANIIGCVCTVFEITPEELKSGSRKRMLVNARRVVSVLLSKKFLMTTTAIGVLLNKDHSSIVFYRNNHDDLYKFDAEFAYYYDTCEKALGIADIKKTDEKYVDYVDTLIVRVEQLTKENEEYKEQIFKLKEIING